MGLLDTTDQLRTVTDRCRYYSTVRTGDQAVTTVNYKFLFCFLCDPQGTVRPRLILLE